MLVYGDQTRTADPRQLILAIERRLDAAERRRPGLEQHAALVATLVEAGRLQQGVADRLFAQAGREAQSDLVDELGGFLLELGASVCRSWDSGYAELGVIPRLTVTRDLPDEVELRLPEGFAFYALYPEAYVDAARRLDLKAPPQVIGIRSIGTALAAVAAAAIDAPPAVTVRPFGDPSNRTIAMDEDLQQRLLGGGEKHYVVVDEGPGHSGSSFAGVATWLRERGIPEGRIALLPSHAGAPGAAATDERRNWWRNAQRQVGDFDKRWPALVTAWTETLVGPLDGPVLDISSGGWRSQRFEHAQQWPAVVPPWERRKFLASAGGEFILIKFAGLGAIGEEKLAIARALHSEKLTPEPLGLVNGFIVERWHADAHPLSGETPVAEIARYIGRRARLLPATSDSGTTVADLFRMVRRNISLEFGDTAVPTLRAWEERERDLGRRIIRVRTDNRLEQHEWLRAADGQLLKTDALDHHQGHDLIGCQDMAWDVAGAIIEFDLDPAQAERLIAAVEHEANGSVDPDLLAFYQIAYLAFRLGQKRLGKTMTSDPEEQWRIIVEGDRYAARLHLLVQSGTRATRPKSSVG